MPIPTVRQAAPRVGGLSQRAAARPDDADLQRELDEARRDLAAAIIGKEIRERLAVVPALLPDQIDELTELLRTGGSSR